MASSALLTPPGSTNVTVKIHPVVLFTICDGFVRRKEQQERVIGTLLGTATDTVIEVKSCYVVPHNESQDQVAVDIVHHKTMYELHQKVTPSEIVVGWFSTSASISFGDALFHDFYTKETASNNPVYLLVDTTMQNKKFTVGTYVSRSLGLGDKPLAAEFMEVPCDVLMVDVEKLGGELFVDHPSSKLVSDTDSLQTSFSKLYDLLEKAAEYVEDVLEGKKKGDPVIGRYLSDTLGMVPQIATFDFEKLFNENVQDTLLITYFSDLLRAHIALSEKLGTPSLPLL